LVRFGELPRSLGDVEHDRRRGATKLISQMASTSGQVLNRVVSQNEKIERELVNIEALMIERHDRIVAWNGRAAGGGTGAGAGAGQSRKQSEIAGRRLPSGR